MSHAIGMFDSGLGGLSVWQAVRASHPDQPLYYVADQARCPYGPQPAADVRQYSREITRFLQEQGASLIVVACNTATGAAIETLRREFPVLSFVGMEPALKPAAAQSQSGVVGVLATQGTFQAHHFQRTLSAHAGDVKVHIQQGDGLVELVENGRADTDEAETLLRRYLTPMLAAGADQIVLGCSHYPFLMPRMKKIVGDQARIIDPSPAVARQVGRLLAELSLPPVGGADRFFSSGPVPHFVEQVQTLLAGQATGDFLPFPKR